ncbi:hypothetical protein GmHk_08G022516 [Glycine max]|nr:hypothetical protein GmHk_08G022516 [Glycine max]
MHASQLMMGLNFEEPWKKGETKKRSKRAERFHLLISFPFKLNHIPLFGSGLLGYASNLQHVKENDLDVSLDIKNGCKSCLDKT